MMVGIDDRQIRLQHGFSAAVGEPASSGV